MFGGLVVRGPHWEQLSSISTEIFLPFVNRHNLVDEAASFYALALCQVIFHLREVEGEISFRHLCKVNFLRATSLVIHFLPSLAQQAIKGVTFGHHERARSKKN